MPDATYRLQLQPGFGFAEAAGIADYLAELGISHVYASPYLQAKAGSTHGYDVVDHGRVNEELGGSAAHLDMSRRFADAGLGQILDIVPNHMAIDRSNAWWWDVLENGHASPFARYFDVDWDPPESSLRNLVLVPVLEDHYGRVLHARQFGLERDGARFLIRYADHVFPVAPRSLDSILRPAADRAASDTLAFIADSFGALPLATSEDPEDSRRRHRDKEVLAQLLESVFAHEPRVVTEVDDVVDEVNRDVERMHALLERQNYRLARWQLGTHQLDYRRFFDITGLVGLRVEDDVVFTNTHELLLGWLRTGVLDGVRVDHIDGLRDPSAYLERLTLAAPGAWLIVEKILETDEHLPDWPVAGTTGYDFARRATGVLIDTTAEQQFTDFYADLTGDTQTFEVLARAAKREVLEKVLAADLARLTHQFFMLCQHHRRHRDYSRHELGAALAETLVASPVYRTYVRRRRDGSTQLTSTDRAVIDRTLAEVTATTGLDAELLEFLGRILRLELDDPAAVELCVSFQQLSAPVMAKGVEDTAFYRHSRFVALNEVGADPGVFGVSLDDFHRENQHIATRWPATMLTTSTHDTKRSEDVRARLAVLTEVPDQWFETVERWAARNERYRHGSWPDRVTEYLLYQTLVGAHPITADRVHTYIEKAVREAKVHTSWLSPNIDYEKATAAFVDAILDDRSFRAELDAFVSTVWDAGWTNALTQVLLKLTAPGVPDLYQGSEVWDLSLVDPDNRRPVDFAARRTLLAEVAELDAEAVMRRTDAGGPKLWLIQRALRVRKAVPDAFAGGAATYEPVFATGQDRDRVIAYVRGDRVMTVAQRFTLCRGDQWGDTQLAIPPGRWHDALGGARYEGGPIAADRLFRAFPAALLMRSE